jgi:hypothetical protein
MPAMKNFNFLVLFLIILVFSGCAKVSHMQELLRLKGYSQNKDWQVNVVQEQNKRFEHLLIAAKNGTLKQYPNQESIWSNFGQPIFDKKVKMDDSVYQVWMYRYSTKLFGSDKVYLYFDFEGQLRMYDFFPGGRITSVR